MNAYQLAGRPAKLFELWHKAEEDNICAGIWQFVGKHSAKARTPNYRLVDVARGWGE